MLARKRAEQGFTLVEILIVVVILGILAAIVIPQFTNASEAARASNLVSQLQSVRSQLELYQIQHSGQYPDLLAVPTNGATAWDWLTDVTDINGDVVAAGPGTFGPYMQKPPLNPFTAGANGSVVAAAAGAAVGWTYNNATGEFRASLLAQTATDHNIDNGANGDATTY